MTNKNPLPELLPCPICKTLCNTRVVVGQKDDDVYVDEETGETKRLEYTEYRQAIPSDNARLALEDILSLLPEQRPSTRAELPDSDYKDTDEGREAAKLARAKNDGWNFAIAIIRRRIERKKTALQSGGVPDGYVLVPVETINKLGEMKINLDHWFRIYGESLIAARPQAEPDNKTLVDRIEALKIPNPDYKGAVRKAAIDECLAVLKGEG